LENLVTEKETALNELKEKNKKLEEEKNFAESGKAEFEKDNNDKEKTLKEQETEIEKLRNKVEKEASDKETFKESSEGYLSLLEEIRDEVYDFFGTEIIEVNGEISEDTN